MYFNYVESFVLCWMLFTILNNLHLQRGMCFWLCWKICTVVEWFDGSMKLPLGKYHPENSSEFSLPWKSQLWKLPHKKTPQVKISSVIIALQQTKKQSLKYLKPKVMKIKASDTVILQKFIRVHQNYIL